MERKEEGPERFGVDLLEAGGDADRVGEGEIMVLLKSMPAPKRALVNPNLEGFELLPGEDEDIRKELSYLLDNSQEWLETPNREFGGRRPENLIGTRDEFLLRQMVRSVVYSGMA